MTREIRHHDLYLSLYVLVGTRPDSLTAVRTDTEIPGYFEVRYVPEFWRGMGQAEAPDHLERTPAKPGKKPAGGVLLTLARWFQELIRGLGWQG